VSGSSTHVLTNSKTANVAFMTHLGGLSNAKCNPCYINYQGNVEVDGDICPKAHQVDDAFKAKVKSMYDELNLSLEELAQWGELWLNGVNLPHTASCKLRF
jgi:hypothetical protein